MNKTFGILLILITVAVPASAENLTLTTYYPAPFGAYDRIRLVPRGTLAGPCDPGLLYVDSATDVPLYCKDIAGTGTWIHIPGAWEQNGDLIYPADTAGNPNLKIGIGTTTPTDTLHVSASGKDAVLKVMRAGGSDFTITSGGAESVVGTADATPLKWQTNGVSRLAILGSGEIGINTDTPTTGLDVNTNLQVTGNATVNGNHTVVGIIRINGQSGNAEFQLTNDSGVLYTFFIDAADGNVLKIKSNLGTTMATFRPNGDMVVHGKIFIDQGGNYGELKVTYINDPTAPGYYALIGP